VIAVPLHRLHWRHRSLWARPGELCVRATEAIRVVGWRTVVNSPYQSSPNWKRGWPRGATFSPPSGGAGDAAAPKKHLRAQAASDSNAPNRYATAFRQQLRRINLAQEPLRALASPLLSEPSFRERGWCISGRTTALRRPRSTNPFCLGPTLAATLETKRSGRIDGASRTLLYRCSDTPSVDASPIVAQSSSERGRAFRMGEARTPCRPPRYPGPLKIGPQCKPVARDSANCNTRGVDGGYQHRT